MTHARAAFRLVAILTLALSTAPLTADDADTALDLPAGHSQHGEAFNEGPRQQAYLMEGTGVIRFDVTSDHPDVQAFVQQGIGQVHGYWYFEAERSFRQAAMLDPDCAIAYWGMALANANNSTRAKSFIREATGRKDHASQREVMYIDALNDFLNSRASRKQKSRDLAKAYETIAQKFPDDIEAKAFLGYTAYKHRSDIGRSYEDVDELLKEVLTVEPLHPIHHFRIHLWDVKNPGNALDSSALCGQSAPNIAHMWHMPGHIYSKQRRYQDAVWQQEASARVDHAQMMRDGVMPDQIHNFAHNNEWLIRSLTYVGRWQDAVDLAKNMIELPQHPRYNTLSKRGSAYYGRLRLFDVLNRFELWEQLIEAGHGLHLEPTAKESEQIKRLRYLGVAYAETGREEQMRDVLADLETRLKKAPTSSGSRPSRGRGRSRRSRTSSPKQSIEKAIAAIKGHAAAHAKDYASALPLLKTAGENTMVRARIQALSGDTDGAIKAAEGYLRSQQQRVQPLASYIEILWQAGSKDRASEQFEQLRKISGTVQFGAPAFDRLRPIATELGYQQDWRLPYVPADDVGQRPELDSLGPFRWQPSSAADWMLKDSQGKTFALKQFAGKPVVVVFYLGSGCLHCTEQLHEFAPMAGEFRDAGIELIAISTDDREGLQQSLEDYEGEMPFPLVSDADMEVFRRYRAYDDFEDAPLHGTFLIDQGGEIRWQDISYEPFMDASFVLDEATRLLGIPPTTTVALADDEADGGEPAAETHSIRRRIDPSGISGSLVIRGGEISDESLDHFYELAQKEKARIVILQSDSNEASDAEAARLKEYWSAKKLETLDRISADGEQRECEPLTTATGVWLLGDQKAALQDDALSEQVRSVIDRGGALGVTLGPDLNLLPDAITVSDGQKADIAKRWATDPTTVAYEIKAPATMVVRGRRIRKVGDGTVRIHLAPSEHRPASSITLNDSRDQADLTALRYSAIDRTLPPFPPEDPPKPHVEKGTVIPIGGGGMPKGIITKFVELAGGKEAKIVVLPTAMPDPISKRNGIAESFRKAGADKVTVLPGRTLSVVESDEYLSAFREATGIWFGGGRQWRFTDAYLDTKVHDLMHDVLVRGGVIMGSSAGASIQGGYLARANPLGNLDIMAEGYERGLGFLPGAAIDQHFAQRRRFKDMSSLVARYPQLLGIGIDEGTAIIVQKNIAEVVGRGGVHFYDRNKPIVEGKPDYETVHNEGRYDLVGRKILDHGRKPSTPPKAADN